MSSNSIISFQCCFDLGQTFGMTDTAFKLDREGAKSPNIIFPAPHLGRSVGVINGLGAGLRINVPPSHEVVKKWKKIAYDIGLKDCPGNEGTPKPNEAHELIKSSLPERFYLTLFAIGIVFVRIDFPFEMEKVEYLSDFAHAYEFSGYEIGSDLKKLVSDSVGAVCSVPARPHCLINDRPDRLPDVIPSFDLVFASRGKMDERVVEKVATDFENGRFKKKIDFEGYGVLHLGYWMSLLEDVEIRDGKSEEKENREYERIWHSMEVARVYYAACEMVQDLLCQSVNEIVDKGKFDDAYDAERCEYLRMLALAVSTGTDFTLATPTRMDLEFFKKYERLTNLAEKRASINSSADILHAVAQVYISRKETSRDRTIARFLLFVTVLTVVSVVTDFVGGIEWNDWFKPTGNSSTDIAREICIAVVSVCILAAAFIATMTLGSLCRTRQDSEISARNLDRKHRKTEKTATHRA